MSTTSTTTPEEASSPTQKTSVALVGGDAATTAPATHPAPVLSFGVPVRNGARFLRRLLDSLLAQDLADFEIVVSDNGSDDGTGELCAEYARRDSRLRYFDNGRDIGQIENFNRTLELARGRYFRWIGVDDWLEPDYARRCVDALDAADHAAGVTTFQDHTDDDGKRLYREYHGERLDSPRLATRFARVMWAFTADYRFFDPIYTMMRRRVLLASRRLQIVPTTDQVLAAEIITHGPFLHIPECLAHRRKVYEGDGEDVYRRYARARHSELDPSSWRLIRAFLPVVWRSDDSLLERLRCVAPVLRHCVISSWCRNLVRARRLLRPALGPLVRSLRRRSG